MAATALGSAILPGAIERTLTNARTGEQRQFVQTELSIEGEARMLALIRDTGARLTESHFPWDVLAGLFDDATPDKPFEWGTAIGLLGTVAEIAPDVVVESALILFGVFPRNEDGTVNPDHDDARRFLLKAITFTVWTDLIETFAKQNDYKRLVDSFGRALAAGATSRRPAEAPSEGKTGI